MTDCYRVYTKVKKMLKQMMKLENQGQVVTLAMMISGIVMTTYRVFEVTATGNLTLDSLTVRHGYCNSIGSFGGGILNKSGTLTVTNSTLSGHSCSTFALRTSVQARVWPSPTSSPHQARAM